jgi:hypothetical protein
MEIKAQRKLPEAARTGTAVVMDAKRGHLGGQRIADHFHVQGPSLPDFGPSWNVAPQTFQPIVRLNRDTG